MNTNVPLADLYGRQEKIDMNMNRLFTGEVKKCKNENCHYSSKDPMTLMKHEANCKK